ncbi:MAG: HlyC/CorC family transporter [Lentisphaeria bacterium]|nr:HlyC/CorC family transporter [Lentisphaeria bacterium]
MDGHLLTQGIILLILVALSGYFSASETAFSSASKTKLKALAEEGRSGASLAFALSNRYDQLISTILIGNNIVNIAAATIATTMFVQKFGEELGATLSTVFMTVIILIFGEISPKSIAKDCAETFSIISAPFLQFLIWVLAPFNFIFSSWKKFLSKFLRLHVDTKMSQTELLMFVDEVQQGGSINKNEGELLRNAIEFSELEAKDILTPRVKLDALPVTATKEEFAQLFYETKYSRLLVYEENIDHIVGVIHQKNFYNKTGITEKSIKEIITPVLFVLAGEKISALMRKLQQKQVQVAVVLDEFGGTYGIVTMEDVLEELVGDIWDEHDDVEQMFEKIREKVYKVDASVHLSEFCEFFDIKVQSEMVLLNGWVQEIFNKIPEKGESFEYENLSLKVLATSKRKVLSLEVTVNEKEEK